MLERIGLLNVIAFIAFNVPGDCVFMSEWGGTE